MNRSQRIPLSLLFLAMLTIGCGSNSTPETASATTNAGPASTASETEPKNSTGTVKLEFVMGDDVEVVELDDVVKGTTLEQLMRTMPEPKMEIKGTGTTAFVHQIGDQATSAGEGWTFRVDGEFSNQGIGTTELDPPTTIRWNFGGFESDQ